MPEGNVFEEDLDRMVAELEATLSAIPEAAIPFDSVKLTSAEQQERFAALSEEDWTEMLKEKPWPEVIDYGLKMERRRKKAEGGE